MGRNRSLEYSAVVRRSGAVARARLCSPTSHRFNVRDDMFTAAGE
jgi:hypothetical protein